MSNGKQALVEYFADAIGTDRRFRMRGANYSLTQAPVLYIGADFVDFEEVTSTEIRSVIIPIRKLDYAYEVIGRNESAT